MGITLQEFENLCRKRQLYTGYVQGLGYVFWRQRSAFFTTGLPSTNQYSTPFYELVVIKDVKNANTGLAPLRGLISTGTSALSLYGIANSIEQLSTKPVIVGGKYIQINPQGTLVRNPNRVFTTRGKIATKVGRKILGAGIIIDTALWLAGEQNFTDAATNVGVSVGIYIIGDICPPAGIVLGILWFIISSSKRSFIPAKSYEEIHGTITPADATRVVRPHYDYSIPFKYNPHYPEFRQGKLR